MQFKKQVSFKFLFLIIFMGLSIAVSAIPPRLDSKGADSDSINFIERLTIKDFLTLIQLPENVDLLNFIRGFSIRLRQANPSRVSFPDISELGRVEHHYVTQGDRRLDALARLLVGDEVCTAVAFDGGNNLYIATNNDDHSMRRFECPLWDRLFTLHGHLRMISRLSRESSSSITHHEWIKTTREDFITEALPYLLIIFEKRQAMIEMRKADANIEAIEDNLKIKMQLLKSFSENIANDFYRFETSYSGSDEDLVESWIEHLGSNLQELAPPEFVLTKSKHRNIREFYTKKLKRFFQDLLKLEQFFSITDHRDPHDVALVNAMTEGRLAPVMVDDGGRGVHAEVRLLARFKKMDKKIPYIGISQLCCAYCNVVMEHVLGVRYFEREDYELAPVRGHHSVPYPWPIHEMFRGSEEFLMEFLGEDLYTQYRRMKSSPFNYRDIAFQDRGDFALTVLERLPILSFDKANKAVAERLGISFPDGDSNNQEADSSVAFSKTPTYFHTRKAFFLFDHRTVIEDGTEEFDKLQQSNKSSRRAFLIDLPAEIGNEGFLYTDDHIHRILREHFLPRRDNFIVTDPAAAIFGNAELLRNVIARAVRAALDGRIVAMPIHLHGNHWVGAIFRRQADGAIQVIYNNPQGYVIDLEQNAVRFVENIQAIVALSGRAPNIIDLHLRQQRNGVDCGPFTVDNLVRLARYAHDYAAELDNLDRNSIIEGAGLQHPASGDATAIRTEHNVIFSALGLPVPRETIEDDFADESTNYDTSPFSDLLPHILPDQQNISLATVEYFSAPWLAVTPIHSVNSALYRQFPFIGNDALLSLPIWSVRWNRYERDFLLSNTGHTRFRSPGPISIFFAPPTPVSWNDI